MHRSKGMVIGFWIATALFSLQIGFTAYALGGRWPGGVGLGGGHRRALGALVFLLAPRAGHAGERLTATSRMRT